MLGRRTRLPSSLLLSILGCLMVGICNPSHATPAPKHLVLVVLAHLTSLSVVLSAANHFPRALTQLPLPQVLTACQSCVKACSGTGRCIDGGVCLCEEGWYGGDCSGNLADWKKMHKLEHNFYEHHAFKSRYVIASHHLRKCKHIVEIGGYRTPITGFLTSRHESVTVLDPYVKPAANDTLNGAPCKVHGPQAPSPSLLRHCCAPIHHPRASMQGTLPLHRHCCALEGLGGFMGIRRYGHCHCRAA